MRTPLLVGAGVLTFGCSDADSAAQPDASPPSVEAGADQHYSFPCLAAPTVTGAPTFTAIYNEIFCSNGCADVYCHGSSARWADLDLSLIDGAYHLLVDRPAGKLIPVDGRPTCAESSLLRVKPGAPEESLLYLKVSGRAPCGTIMPPPGSGARPLAPEKIEQIRRWIELGAKSFRDE